MYKRYFIPPKQQSYFLFGPRGTGKSTWLKSNYLDAYWIDLLNPETFRFYSTSPEKLYSLDEQPKKQIVIDEIQKVPELLSVVHALIEEKKNYQFIMTGSSSRKLKRHGVNLLGGRALLKYMPPFFASEIGSSFNLERNIRLGMLPVVLDSSDPEEILRAYVGIYLKEEVQAESIVRSVPNFARFLEIMSFSHGSVLNGSNIARECQISRKTVDSYLLILEDLLLSFRLSVFRRKAKRALTSHQKFYYFDSGVFYSLRPKSFYDQQSERDGVALEGLVGQHLRAWVNAQIENYELSFWQTVSKVEVDFIVTGPDCFYAIEVKNGSVVHPVDLKGLNSFQEDYPEATALLLYRGKIRYKEGNILCIPVEDFLMKINPNNSLSEVLKQ